MAPGSPPDIAANLAETLRRIDTARPDGAVPPPALVAVSKRQPDERIDAALAAGHRLFGENRVQEAQQRWTARRQEHPDLTLHLIGPLQTNKAAEAVALFDVIEVVDRPKLARPCRAKWRARTADPATSRSIRARSRRNRACCRTGRTASSPSARRSADWTFAV